MGERREQRVVLRAEPGIVIGSVIVLPTARTVLLLRDGAWAMASKAPHALILRDATGMRAVAADGSAVSLDALRAQVPGVDAAFAA